MDYMLGAICHPSHCEFVRHTIFFGLPSIHILELLRDLPRQVRAGRRMGKLTATHKILTSWGEVEYRLFYHIFNIVHLRLAIGYLR
jgi:hypothetical protein